MLSGQITPYDLYDHNVTSSQLAEHCTGIVEVMHLNPVQA